MKASPPPFLNQYKVSPKALSYTGPGKFDTKLQRVVPDGFGQIDQENGAVIWGEVRTVIRPSNRFEVIFCGLKYEIHSSPLPLNCRQTELHMFTHNYDGILQEKLTLFYHHPNDRWDLAILVRCEISQPFYTSNKPTCMLLQSLKNPLKGFERGFFSRMGQHSLISFENELYFSNGYFKTIKKIMRLDDNALEYDGLMNEFSQYRTKKPSKSEINQGYFNSFEASVSTCSDISKITGCSYEKPVLDDGEGMIYVNHPDDSPNFHLTMGYLDFSDNHEVFPKTNYIFFLGKKTESYFYKGKGILRAEGHAGPNGQGMICHKKTIKNGHRTIWYQGEFAQSVRSGKGVELTVDVEYLEDTSSTLLHEVKKSSLMQGSWLLDNKDGLFTQILCDKTEIDINYVNNQRLPLPFVFKQGESVSIVAYVNGATAEQFSYYVTLSPAFSPRFVKVIDVHQQLFEEMSFMAFLEAINNSLSYDYFAVLLLEHASFNDLCFFQSEARSAGRFDLVPQFFSSRCGSFNLPHDCHFFPFETHNITNSNLWSYLDTAISYLASFQDDSGLLNGTVILKRFHSERAFNDYEAVLKYFFELNGPWLLMLSERKTMSQQDKRMAFESLLVRDAFPWIFRRVFMIYSSVIQFKVSKLIQLTQEEQVISEMFEVLRRDSINAKLQRLCDEFCDVEKTYREDVIASERQFFKYFLDTAPLSKDYINARESLYQSSWDAFFSQLEKQELQLRADLQEEQKLGQVAIKCVQKKLYAMREVYKEETKIRYHCIKDEVSDWQDILQVVIRSFSQIEEQYIADESLHRNRIIGSYDSVFSHLSLDAARQNAQVSFFNHENKSRSELISNEIILFNQLKIRLQLDYVIQYVSKIRFDRPFDVYIVGSAVVNRVMGHDWRENQDIDVMIVARSPGEFLQISEENANRHGVRISQHIWGLYTTVVNVPGAGRRRVDLKVSDFSPIIDFNRRDFTVGALYQASNGDLLDPSERGLFDLRLKQLDTVKPAAESFSHSPVQMLRVIKYFMNGYTLSQDIVDAMKNWSATLNLQEWSHICAVVRTHLGSFNNYEYTQALKTYGLAKNLFGFSSEMNIVDTLRGINSYVFRQNGYGFFPPVRQVQEQPTKTIPLPSFFQTDRNGPR